MPVSRANQAAVFFISRALREAGGSRGGADAAPRARNSSDRPHDGPRRDPLDAPSCGSPKRSTRSCGPAPRARGPCEPERRAHNLAPVLRRVRRLFLRHVDTSSAQCSGVHQSGATSVTGYPVPSVTPRRSRFGPRSQSVANTPVGSRPRTRHGLPLYGKTPSCSLRDSAGRSPDRRGLSGPHSRPRTPNPLPAPSVEHRNVMGATGEASSGLLAPTMSTQSRDGEQTRDAASKTMDGSPPTSNAEVMRRLKQFSWWGRGRRREMSDLARRVTVQVEC